MTENNIEKQRVSNFIDAILVRADDAGLRNVSGLVNDQYSVKLEPASIDLAFISDTYHHFEYPVTYSRSIASALRPDGQVIVVDFKRIPGISSPWVLGHVRAGKQTFVEEMNQAGLVLLEELDFMQTQYFLRLGLRGDGQAH